MNPVKSGPFSNFSDYSGNPADADANLTNGFTLIYSFDLQIHLIGCFKPEQFP